MKVTANVMGTNWVHLQDGSGSAADSSNDLLVTSKDEPKVGDIVIATGVVKTDVDFGAAIRTRSWSPMLRFRNS